MGSVLGTKLEKSRYRGKSQEMRGLRAAGHRKVKGPHRWSLTLNSDRCLISGFQPQGQCHACPWHPIQLFLNPPPCPLLGQSPICRVGAHTQPFPAFWFSQELAASPPPASRNSEKLEEPGYSLPPPQARSSWMEQLGRGNPGVWTMVI